MKIKRYLVFLLLTLAFAEGQRKDKTWGMWESILSLEEENHQLKLELQNERANRVIALCQPQNFGEAEIAFHRLNNFTSLHYIMKKLYGDPYHEPLVGFTKVLHTLSDRLTAYHKWMNLLEVNRGLLEGGIIVFSKIIQDEISNMVGPAPQDLLELGNRLDIYQDTVLSIWARDIQRGNYESINDFASPPSYHMIGRIFEGVLDKLIQKVLGNGETENLMKALDFAANLRWNMHRGIGLKTIYDQIKDDRRLVVAYKFKEVMNSCFSGPDPSQKAKEIFEKLKQDLPPNVRQLLWHEKCNLKNKFYNGAYLYGDQENFNADNKMLCTWEPSTPKVESPFVLEPRINSIGDGLEFRIENKYWPDYKYFDVHTSGDGDGTIKKYVSLRKNAVADFNWRVELSALDGEVMLYYIPLQSYLMVDFIKLDNNRRTAILWATQDLDPTSHVWTLECV